MEDGTSDLDVPGPEARGLEKDVRVGHVKRSGSRESEWVTWMCDCARQ